jgi:hypothetical protein
MGLGGFFKKVGKFGLKVFSEAQSRGLTDDLLTKATAAVTAAKEQFLDNANRREWAVSGLVAGGVKESIARMAVELALQAIKSKL